MKKTAFKTSKIKISKTKPDKQSWNTLYLPAGNKNDLNDSQVLYPFCYHYKRQVIKTLLYKKQH